MVSSKWLQDAVALALEVLGGVDAALRADGVRALDRDDGEEVDLAAGFGDLDDGGESGEAAAYYDDSGCCCHALPSCELTSCFNMQNCYATPMQAMNRNPSDACIAAILVHVAILPITLLETRCLSYRHFDGAVQSFAIFDTAIARMRRMTARNRRRTGPCRNMHAAPASGCAGFVEFGGATLARSIAMPGWSGMTSSGAGGAADDGVDAGEAHEAEGDADDGADVAEVLAGLVAGGDAPLGGEEPDAVGEVPAGGDHGDDVDGEHPGVGELDAGPWEGCAGVLGKADAAEALTPDVLDDVDEGDEAGDALREVHPVAGPGIDVDVGAAAEGDEDAVERVEGERDEDEGPLEDADERQGVEEVDLLWRRRAGPLSGLEVGDDVLDRGRRRWGRCR